MPTSRDPHKGDFVHYVLPSNAHRPAIVVRVFPSEDAARMALIDLTVFLDGRNDAVELLVLRDGGKEMGVPPSSIWVPQVSYEMAGGVTSWHWPDECSGHDND